ncbi:hypothetical protein L486_00778 [Kwoniella mangroviensis CBS 10435]|uniref:Fe2OG dioxygenase domain-containing protein n=1 Tax=Kwoniella mangroviensis CBS 10435 TaxID=1331196 RepID=A0A1B9J0E1_9TREE|nr:uncharacterized protein I203_04311 [Kwoniella mangroviensis CBS 8507]OCF61134.1 hypothetical protein L486_00778 [Kwoniella mangroviensis CBS 10435]OCF66735.1 hypothetical protein I203_04311 [Kwoniella mangroviensis CBS 8507]
MGNGDTEDINWVSNPWNHTRELKNIPLDTKAQPDRSTSSSDTGYVQELLQHNNGLILINDFLSPGDYEVLLNTIKDEFRIMEESKSKSLPTDETELQQPRDQSKPKTKAKLRRLAIHYGPKYDYTTNHASPNPTPVPDYIQDLIEMIKPYINGLEINQATLQYYPPGSGIPPHIDTHSCFEKEILSFSLGARVNMGFQKGDEATAMKMFAPRRCVGGSTSTSTPGTLPSEITINGNQSLTPTLTPKPLAQSTYHEIPLQPNSLCIMSNEVRYAWTHGIRSRATDDSVKREDRYSITFRKVDFQGVCKCEYGVWCDSQQDKNKE